MKQRKKESKKKREATEKKRKVSASRGKVSASISDRKKKRRKKGVCGWRS